MVDQEQQSSPAEQRMLAVARLKRAASLPRMKDGRRPPMHVEAVSEGERAANEGEKLIADAEKAHSDKESNHIEEQKQQEVENSAPDDSQLESPDPDIDADIEERAISPGPPSRARRRSRSRSRSRGSKDFKNKARGTQSPIPSSLVAGDSSQDESPPPPPPPPITLPIVPPLISPIPSRFAAFQNSRFLGSPTPVSPDPSLFYPGTSPPTPMLPSLEAIQKNIVRSRSTGGAALDRRKAFEKLTNGKETYDPSPSPTPPPFGKLTRNNTVSGGERTAARQLLLSRLGGRVANAKETDTEQASGGEERTAPSPTPKRRRRRSRRGSSSAIPAISDSEFVSTSPNTPVVPPTPLPPSFDKFLDIRAQTATPNQATNSHNQSSEHILNISPTPEPKIDEAGLEQPDIPEPTRRRSVLVEDEEEDRYPPQTRYPGLPATPPQRYPANGTSLRVPYSSDAPSNASTDSAPTGAVGVPVYLSQTPSRHDLFPISPFTTPLKERAISVSDEDEEQVLYPADSFRPRTPYVATTDAYDREISWIASPVPVIRMPIDDDDDEDDDEQEHEEQLEEEQDHREHDEEREYEETPPSATSSVGFSPPEGYDDVSRMSSDSKRLVIESEISPDNIPSYTSPSPTSVAALSQTTSNNHASDGSASPQSYPTRLSIASRIQSDRSPLNGEFSDWDDRFNLGDTSMKRNETASPSTWEKVKSTFARAGSSSGRRSRSNSIATRERRDYTDSSVSRESGASMTSSKTDKGDPANGSFSQQTKQPLMQSPSASASIQSLGPHTPSRGGPSPIPPASSADLAKYTDAKLQPFPGIKKLEEERNRAKGLPAASSSTPDVSMLSSINDDQPSFSAGNTPAQSPEISRERKLSHQASDTRLLAKYAIESACADNQIAPLATQNGGPLTLKLPMTLPGVKQWLSKNNKKKMLPTPGTPPSSSSLVPPPAMETQSSPTNKIPLLSDLLRRKDSELGPDWEDIGSTPTSASGDTLLGKKRNSQEAKETIRDNSVTPVTPPALSERADYTDTEKTPKAKKVTALDYGSGVEAPYLSFEDSPPMQHSRSDPLLSATPDPSSSLSDYPAHSTSESSSTSSQYSLGGHVGPQGTIVLERLDESLMRGSRNTMWASVDDPPRKLVLSSPVLQVVNPNTVKDRFLFLFNDTLVIAKPVIQEQDNLMDTYKPSPLDRKYVVKSVVLLRNLRFCPDRTEVQAKASNSNVTSRTPALRTFIDQFADDPEDAIGFLFSKIDSLDAQVLIGHTLFKTLELDRARLGELLSRRHARHMLKAYLDSFGFVGLRIDRALRVFLQSINIPPTKVQQNYTALDYHLDSFASRWYEANAKIVPYDKDMAIRLVRAIVQLNDLLHDSIAQEAGLTSRPKRGITSRDFLDAFRRYDVRYLVSDELLEAVYESILKERLCQAPLLAGLVTRSIVIKRSVPARLTYKVQSEPIILRLMQPDPQLSIHLYGQDLIFDPPMLTFTKSAEASFRVMGTSLGSKTMIMCRSGPNAVRYAGLPLSSTIVIERAFMRNTFQVAFLNHNSEKRRYMFSVDDPLIRHQWVVSLKRHIDNAAAAIAAPAAFSSQDNLKFFKAAELVAFKVLQETLIGSSVTPTSVVQSALQRFNHSSQHNQNGHVDSLPYSNRSGPTQAFPTTAALHVRSKSRSRMYHRHGAGVNELDLSNSIGGDANERADSQISLEEGQIPRVDGFLWSGRDLEMQCQQNSSIPLVLSFLQIGTTDQGQNGKSF